MDHVAVRPRRGEGRVHFKIIIIGYILGGKLGQKLGCLGGKLPLRPPP